MRPFDTAEDGCDLILNLPPVFAAWVNLSDFDADNGIAVGVDSNYVRLWWRPRYDCELPILT